MSTARVPTELADHIVTRHGQEAHAWLVRLPALVATLADRRSLEVEEPFSDVAGASWIAPAGVVDGVPAVLKVGWPHREARTEAAGLRHFQGRGSVRLLRADAEVFALVEERCLPGGDLWSLPVEEGNAVAAGVLAQLWRPTSGAGPIEPLSQVVEEWLDEFIHDRGDYPPRLVELAAEQAEELVATQSELVVLHGDFNPGNVLRSSRDDWLSLDPKPLIGEPAYDLAQWFANRAGVWSALEQEAEVVRQLQFFAGALGLDPGRIARWSFVKALGWAWGAEATEFFARVAGLA